MGASGDLEMRIRQRVEEALERDGRGEFEEATVDDRERSAFGRGPAGGRVEKERRGPARREA